MRRALILLISGIAASFAQLPAREQGQWWIISGSKAVIFNDQVKKLAEIEVGLNAYEPVFSPDGRYLAVSSNGTHTVKIASSGRREYWPAPGSGAAVTILRADTLEVVGRQAVRFRPNVVRFTDNQTLVVISSGQMGAETGKPILPAISVLNIPGAEIRKQVDLDSPPADSPAPMSGDAWYDAKAGLLHIVCRRFRKVPAAFVTFDPAAGTIRQTPLESDVVRVFRSERSEIAYIVLESGVVVVNAQGALAGSPIKVGKEMAFFTPVPGSTRYLLAGRTGKAAKLMAIEDGRVAKEVALERAERCVFGNKTRQVIVTGTDKGVVLDRDTLEVKGTLKLPGDYIDVMLDPAERNLYVHKGGSVAVIDVARDTEIANVGVGRGFQKFSAALAQSPYYYREGPAVRASGEERFALAWPVSTMAFSPSGSHLFAYHAQAQDLTIVDTAAYAVDAKVGLGSPLRWVQMWQLPGGTRLLAFSGNTVRVFDMEEGRPLAKKDFPHSLVAWDEWLGRIGMLFVRSTSGTTAVRADSLDVAREFGSEFALTAKALDQGREGMFFFAPERRFVITTAKGARLYDYNLEPVGDLVGVTDVTDVFRVEPPVKNPGSE